MTEKTTKPKTLSNTTANGARKNVKDLKTWGDADMFKLISKASSEEEGWMKSTKALETGNGVIVQVTTQQRNPDGSYALAEAVTFVPFVKIEELYEDKLCTKVAERRLVPMQHGIPHPGPKRNVQDVSPSTVKKDAKLPK